MKSRVHIFTVLVGLVLAAPAVADDRFNGLDGGVLDDINALTIESDFTVFIRKGVSRDVQRAALRRLWVLMQLPVSCDDLCYEPERAASGLMHLATEKPSFAAR